MTFDDTIYDVQDTKTKTKFEKAGYVETKVNVNGTTKDVLQRKVTKKVHAYPRNGRNQPLIPLGGPRGYVIGALVALSKDIGVQQGQLLYGILTWLRNGGIKIEPYMIPVHTNEISIADFWITEAKSKAYYEQIKETEVTLTVNVIPRDGFNAELVKELLKRAEGIGISPKRRGYWKIIEFA